MTKRGAYLGLCPKAQPNTLGARIRRIRIAWGWTQGQLAERLGTDQQIVSSWERGKSQLPRAFMALLAEFLGISVEALATGVGFTIPDLPQGPGGSALRVSLPPVEPGTLVAMRVLGGAPQELTLSEARAMLGRTMKQKGKVWIVVEAPEV